MESKNKDLIIPTVFSPFSAVSSRIFSKWLPLCSWAAASLCLVQESRLELYSFHAPGRREVKTPNQDDTHTYLFLLLVEVVNYNTNKEVQSEEWAKDDKNHKEKVLQWVLLKLGLLFFLLGIFLMRGENN